MIVKFFNGKYYSNLNFIIIGNEFFFYKFFLGKKICVTILFIGNNFSSNLYVKNKVNSCYFININVFLLKFSMHVKLETLLKIIFILNNDYYINSIIIQLPLSARLNKLVLFNSICLSKDVDLLNTLNFGKYIADYSNLLIPSAAASIIFILKKFKIETCGLKSVIFGFSNIVGKPITFELIKLGITVSIINKMDNDFLNLIKHADLIVSAIGNSYFFSFNFVSYGAVIVDVGINECDYYVMAGDFNLSMLNNIVNLITPVPGGVGPLTIINLLVNIVKVYVNKNFEIIV